VGAYASFLLIEEVDVIGRRPRALFLAGNGLPHQGASWKSAQKVPTTWYPGNKNATQQLLAFSELPSTWEGEWKRTLLAKSGSTFTDSDGTITSLVAPQQLRDAFEALLSEGALLRVTWRSSGPDFWDNDSVVREGRATSWEFPTTRAHDIAWSVEFAWKGRGGRPTSPISSRDANLVAQVARSQASAAAWAASIATTGSIAAGKVSTELARAASIGAPNSLTLGQLESLADYPSEVLAQASRKVQYVTGQLKSLAGIAQKIATVPAQVQTAAVAMSADIARTANDFGDTLGQVPAELLSTKTGTIDVVRAARYFAGTADTARVVVDDAVTLMTSIRAFVAERAPLQASSTAATLSGARQGDILAVHVAREGDTLVGLSMTYYGDPDHAADIAKANRLPWSQVSPAVGHPVVIPALTTGRPTGA
jgi:hypothetical protein